MRTFLAWLRERRGRRRERWDPVLERLALQHQVRVLRRSGTRRPRPAPWDRLFWLILSRLWSRWRGSLIMVQPGTVLKWRRRGLSLVFGCRHDGRFFGCRHDGRWRGGRPRVDAEVRDLIAPMARANLLWGAPRIHGELLKLGFTLSEATVSRYLRRRPRPGSQRWATFIRNHLLLRPAGFVPGPEYRQHVGRGHFDRVAPVPAFERRSPEQGQPMRPAFRLPEAGLCDANPTGWRERAQGHNRSLESCLPLRPITHATRHGTGVAHSRAPPPLPRPIFHAARLSPAVTTDHRCCPVPSRLPQRDSSGQSIGWTKF